MTKEKYLSAETYEEDLYKVLTELVKNERTPENLLKIKKITHGIHTHITYLMGTKFLGDLDTELKNQLKYDEMCNNGFDIELPYKGKQIVAEIKGNMPINNDQKTYGANQRDSIIKDIDYLIYGKNKSKNYKPNANKTPLESLKSAYRFLIVLKNNEIAIHTLTENLQKKSEYAQAFHFPKAFSWKEFSTNAINIILIDL